MYAPWDSFGRTTLPQVLLCFDYFHTNFRFSGKLGKAPEAFPVTFYLLFPLVAAYSLCPGPWAYWGGGVRMSVFHSAPRSIRYNDSAPPTPTSQSRPNSTFPPGPRSSRARATARSPSLPPAASATQRSSAGSGGATALLLRLRRCGEGVHHHEGARLRAGLTGTRERPRV